MTSESDYEENYAGRRQVHYFPEIGFAGIDTFEYQLCVPTRRKSTPNCATATVFVYVVPDSDRDDDVRYTMVNTPVDIDFLGSSCGIVDPSTFAVMQPVNGTLTNLAAATYSVRRYTPNKDFVGVEKIGYEACIAISEEERNAVGLGSEPLHDLFCKHHARVSVHVLQTMMLQDDHASAEEGMTVEIPILANDKGADVSMAGVTIISGPYHGSVLFDRYGAMSNIAYTPAAKSAGMVDEFVYRVCGTIVPPAPYQNRIVPECQTAKVTIGIVLKFMVNDDFVVTERNTPVVIDVLANDMAVDPTTLTLIDSPSQGDAFRRRAEGGESAIVFHPPTDFAGVVTFSYQVCSDHPELQKKTCVERNVTVTVLIYAEADVVNIYQREDPVAIYVLANDDPDADPATVDIEQPPVSGNVIAIDPTSGAITYQPHSQFTGKFLNFLSLPSLIFFTCYMIYPLSADKQSHFHIISTYTSYISIY